MDLLQEFLVEQLLDESLESVFNDYYQSTMSRELFDEVIALDPTFDITKDKLGEYGKWLLRVISKKTVPENEFDQVKDVLSVFNEQKRFLAASGKNDINKYKTLQDIRDALATIQLTDNQIAKINRKKRRSTDYGDGAEFIVENDDWEIWSPTTSEAAMQLGRGTDWCTAMTRPNTNFFDLYTSDLAHNTHLYQPPSTGDYGRLFSFIPKSQKAIEMGKYQAQVVYSSDGTVKYMGDFKDRYDHGNPSKTFPKFILKTGLYDLIKTTDMVKTPTFKSVETLQNITKTHKISLGGQGFSRFITGSSDGDDIILSDNETRVSRDFLLSDEAGIKEVVIENSANTITLESRNFALFEKLESLIFSGPTTIETITNRAFRNMINLKTIVLPNTLKNISKEVFSGCINLGEVVLPDTLTFIGFNAFADCPKLKLKMNRRGKHNKLQVPEANLSSLKSRLVYIGEEEQVKEESLILDESFSPSMPQWLKKWLSKYKRDTTPRERSQGDGLRVALTGDERNRGDFSYYNHLVSRTTDIEENAIPLYIDLNKANFVSAPVPTSVRDEHLKYPYIPFYHISYKYRGQDDGRVVEDVYVPGINDLEEPEWDYEDKPYKRYAIAILLSHTIDFCYVDSREPSNFISLDLRHKRAAAQSGAVTRLTPDQVKKLKSVRGTSGDVTDKSGYELNPEFLVAKLNKYNKEHYAQAIKGYYKRLNVARSTLQKVLSSVDINNRRVDEDTVQEAYGKLFNAIYTYRAFKYNVEEAVKTKDKEEREQKLNRCFGPDYGWGTRNNVKTVRDNIKDLESRVKEISLATLESLE